MDLPEDGKGATTDSARMAETIVERFGGIRPMAAKLGVPVTTVQGWKKRGHIPASRRAELLAASLTHGIPLTGAELDLAASGGPAVEPAEETPVAETPVIGAIPEVEPAVALPPTAPAQPEPAPEPRRDPPRTEIPRAEPPRPQPAAPSPAKPAAAIPVKPARGGRGIAALALLLALGGAGMGALALQRSGGIIPAFRDLAGGSLSDPRMDEIDALRRQVVELAARPAGDPGVTAEIERLSREVAALRAGPSPTVTVVPRTEIPTGEPSDGPDVAALTQRLSAMERLVEGIAARAPETGAADALAQQLQEVRATALVTAQNLQGLSTRVEQLQASVGDLLAESGGAEGLALVVATGQLHTALLSGRPFARELDAVRALATDDPEFADALRDLEPRAAAGLVPELALKERFEKLAGDMLRAERERPDAGWAEQALGRLSALVTVRRSTGEVAGDGADAVLARAQNALDGGNLKLAVSEVEALQGPAASVAAPWLADARARVAAETAAGALAQRAVTMLSAGAQARDLPADAPAEPPAEEPAQGGGTP
ncbi:MAG TPA: mitofilin family membrane protein [Azospirillaceae bacterium]|nr:mitofilin family membrane protein [Azospirillaceae bacterium]